jgi:hypothetical protein
MRRSSNWWFKQSHSKSFAFFCGMFIARAKRSVMQPVKHLPTHIRDKRVIAILENSRWFCPKKSIQNNKYADTLRPCQRWHHMELECGCQGKITHHLKYSWAILPPTRGNTTTMSSTFSGAPSTTIGRQPI